MNGWLNKWEIIFRLWLTAPERHIKGENFSTNTTNLTLKDTTLGLYELEGDLISLLVSSVLFCSPSNLRGFNMIYLDQLMPFRMQRGKAMVAFLAKGEGNGGFPRQGGRQWCPSKARGKAMVSFQGKGEGNGGLPS